MRIYQHLGSALLLWCGFSCAVLGADKSGVGPNTISLPKGPGAIEGLGESFQPSLNTGTAKYGVTLKVPPGTAGHAPSLGLSYEGGSGNGPLGFGWNLPMSYVQRRTDNGMPTYGENVGFAREELFINEMREELVPQAGGYFFSRNEGSFIRYRQVGPHWEGVTPNGTVMQFGLTPEGRVDDGSTNRVFSWLLQRQTDTRGNTILYSYASFPGLNNTNQKYLRAISYGPGAPPWNNFHFVRFNYEDRPDWFEDCRSGFIVRTGKRLQEIVIGTQGPALANHLAGDFNGDGQTDYLNRRYGLEYLNYAGTNSHWSLLSKVLLVGADGTNSLPPSTFGYDVSNPPETLSASGQVIGGANEPPLVMDNGQTEFLDLNGDGLPDLLKTDPGGGSHTAFLNRGEVAAGASREISWQSGVPVDSADGQAWLFNLQSTAPVAHLADMDGDGLADLAVTSLDGSVLYFANRGNLVWGPRRNMSVEDSAPPSPFGNPCVRTADVDFDKRIDIIQSVSAGDGADYRIWFNLGNQNYSPSVTVPQSAGVLFSAPGVQITDFNGDRVPDIARLRPESVTVTAGLGYGRFAEPITVSIPDLVLADTQAAKATLMDINGDGLSDLVIERAVPGQLWYWLNLGNYRFSSWKIITDMPTGVGGNAVIRWADVNGNGTTDLIYADSSSVPRMQSVDIGQLLNSGAAPNVLVTVANGIGRVTTLHYQSSTFFALADAAAGKPWPDLMPNPVQVVASVTTSDSLGHRYVTQFRYHNGYYDPVEKQFRGFAHAEQVEEGDPTAPTLVTRSHFDTGRTYEAMKGRLLGLSVEEENRSVFSMETNFWTRPPVTLYTGTNGTNVVFVHPTGKVSIITERGQGTPRRVESAFAYDRFGNQTTNADYGIVENGDRTAFNDERITTTEYALNTNAWIVRLPSRQESQDENGVVISRSQSYYDDETFSGQNFGSVNVGNLTLTRAWINPAVADSYVKAARSKYDVFGNPVVLLDPLATASGSDVNFSQGHAREIGYDSRFHTYPVAETIHVGSGTPPLVAQAAYDEGLAMISASVDFNTNRTAYAYDAFGRLIHIVKPYDTPAYPTVEYDYHLAVSVPLGGEAGQGTGIVNFIETRQLDRTPGTAGGKRDHYLIARQFVDGLGRPLLSKQEAEPAPGSSTPRVVVSGATLFNQRLKASRALNPHFSLQAGGTIEDRLAFENIEAPGWQGSFESNGSLVTLGLGAAHQSATEYDATLRPIKVTNPDGTFNQTVYEPLLTRSFDENDTDPASPHSNTPSLHYSDGLGRMVRVDEITRLNDDGTVGASPVSWSTRYEYDLNDRLTRITDSQNNVKWLEYDGLKRKTFMSDPDRGVMSCFYDDASNLRETVDAKGQHIRLTYDGVNRLLTETYVGSLLSPRLGENRGEGAVNVAYHYDAPAGPVDNGDGTKSPAQNTRGMLAFVSDGSGEEHTSYDNRGRPHYAIKRIPDPLLQNSSNPSLHLVAYRTSFDYDSLDRVTRLVYPDNDQVTYAYNARNLLDRIGGGPSGSILSNLVYLPSGQQQRIDYGNGVRTTYAYDPRLRLNSLLTHHASRVADPLISFGYEFDGVSNLKAIADLRPTSTVPATDRRRNSQAFGYDDLYRLTSVQYNLPNPSAANGGQISYRYDRIGNMLAQSSDMEHFEKGVSLTDLGTMGYGGTAGKSGRLGRQPNDPPGPHALTSIRNPESTNRHRAFPYDANGNMTNIDGLVCTWDFKDRLVAIEDATMRAEYTYDCTDRRITKRVIRKSPLPGLAGEGHDGVGSFTTIYVGKHFEVRERETPTKYVFNGETRVASITGSLSANTRVQRFRFYQGWNLSSLAVMASNTVQQLSGAGSIPTSIQAAYKWEAASGTWQTAINTETLPAGSVLWIKAATNFTTSLVGIYTDPSGHPIATNGTFLPSAGLEGLSFLGVRADVALTLFDAGRQTWQSRIPWLPGFDAGFPVSLAPGAAVFAQTAAPGELEMSDSTLRIRYYHQDHLGSSSVISDSQGVLVEETAFYPFGLPRNEHRLRQVEEHYKFTQKEQDLESGLQYFEARYLAGSLGRFITTDSKYAHPDRLAIEGLASFLNTPQHGNPYAYARNNPIKYFDPTGHEDREPAATALEAVGFWSDKTEGTIHSALGSSGEAFKSAEGLYKTTKVLGVAADVGALGIKAYNAYHNPTPENISDVSWGVSTVFFGAANPWLGAGLQVAEWLGLDVKGELSAAGTAWGRQARDFDERLDSALEDLNQAEIQHRGRLRREHHQNAAYLKEALRNERARKDTAEPILMQRGTDGNWK